MDLLDEDVFGHISSSPSINEEEIDFQYVYALKTFVATEQGQASAVKGDAMILLNDSNSYWWLVRLLKDSSVGFLPAEHIETPWERLARLNKYRNGEVVASPQPTNSASKAFGKLFKSSSIKKHTNNGTTAATNNTAAHSTLDSPANKSVTFTNQSTYISASEWEYSEEGEEYQSDEEDNDYNDYNDDADDNYGQEDHAIDAPGSLASASASSSSGNTQRYVPINVIARTSDTSNSDEEDLTVAAADSSNTEPLLVKKVRGDSSEPEQPEHHPIQSIRTVNSAKPASAAVDQTLQPLIIPAASNRTPPIEQISSPTESVVISPNASTTTTSTVTTNTTTNTSVSSPTTSMMPPPKLAKKQSNGLLSKIKFGNRNVSVAGEDLGATIIGSTATSIDVSESESITSPTTPNTASSEDNNQYQNKLVGSRPMAPTALGGDVKQQQTKRRSFLKAKSSLENFGKRDRETRRNSSLENVVAPLKEKQNDKDQRTVSVSSVSSGGSAGSASIHSKDSAFSKLFKRRKSRESLKTDPVMVTSPTDTFSLASLESDVSGAEPIMITSKSRNAKANTSSINASHNIKKVGQVNGPATSSSNGPSKGQVREPIKELPTTQAANGQSKDTGLYDRTPMSPGPGLVGSLTTNSSKRNAPSPLKLNTEQHTNSRVVGSRPLASPLGPRSRSNERTAVATRESIHSPQRLSMASTRDPRHGSVILDLPENASFSTNEKARTSIISQSRISASSVIAEEVLIHDGTSSIDESASLSSEVDEKEDNIDDDDEEPQIIGERQVNVSAKEEAKAQPLQKPSANEVHANVIHISQTNKGHRTKTSSISSRSSERSSGGSGSGSGSSSSTASATTAVNVSPSRHDQSISISPRREIVKKHWNGSSTSSFGNYSASSAAVEPPSMFTMNSSNSDTSLATIKSTSASYGHNGKVVKIASMSSVDLDKLHPEIAPMYKDASEQLDQISAKLDQLMRMYGNA